MRNVVVTEFLSLDGVMEEPAWTFTYWNDEIARFKGEESTAGDALLLGRVTYLGFAAAWPESEDEGADSFNGVRKYVASRTLEDPLAWNNSAPINDDIVAAITERKRRDARPAHAWGTHMGKVVGRCIRATRAHYRHHDALCDFTKDESIGQ